MRARFSLARTAVSYLGEADDIDELCFDYGLELVR